LLRAVDRNARGGAVMTQRSRIVFFTVSIVILVATGWWFTGGLGFILTQFWFASGFFLLLLLSLVDQPHFSKDADVFANSIAGGLSLLLVAVSDRSPIWWLFLAWTAYLLASSYWLMWRRSRPLDEESQPVQYVSRINRIVGSPSALFSAFLLWGAVIQFGPSSTATAALFTYWAVFTLLNVPQVARVFAGLLDRGQPKPPTSIGTLARIVSPRVAEITLFPGVVSALAGRRVSLGNSDRVGATGVLIDDRVVGGQRLGRIAITSTTNDWWDIGDRKPAETGVRLDAAGAVDPDRPVSVVDVGSSIGRLVFKAHPDIDMQSGEVVWVEPAGAERAYYQVVAAVVSEDAAADTNAIQSVRVTAGELGNWIAPTARFEPMNWVPPAGTLVHRAAVDVADDAVAADRHSVGVIPNSEFPIHVGIADLVTHNSALIGVTGSGKSFLAFDLIEGIVAAGIKVLILDVSRQHDLYLRDLAPTAIARAEDVAAWFTGDSSVGIHQFALANRGYALATAQFVEAALAEVSKQQLRRGRNLPARLCLILEEAHSLIPEWSQVAERNDTDFVNRTARAILQGRKYGMGAMIITQRTANVTKTILNQCNTIFALQSFDQTGLDFLRNYMGEEYSQAISTLPSRHAILVGMASSSKRPVVFRVHDFANRWQEEPEVGDGPGRGEEDAG
jgi:hypothetical protein